MRHRKCLPLLSFLFQVILAPFTTPLPASLVNHDPETLPLRNGLTDGSDFARVAADAAAAAAEQGNINVVDPICRTVQPERADRFVEVDASRGALLPEANRALTVAQEQVSLMIAGTVDGHVHALDADTGELRWSFSTGDPLVKSYQQLPGTLDEKWWLIPTLDGSMLVKTAHGLGRPSLNVRLLVDQTPFLAQGGTFFTGSKVSRIFGVDAQTGEVRQVLSGDTADSLKSDRRLLARSGSDDDVIWIGRTDYTVRAFDVPTGQEQWNLTVGEFVSLDNLKIAAGSNRGRDGDGNGGGLKGGISSAAGSRAPSLLASPDGSLRLKALPGRAGKKTPHLNLEATDEWKTPLSAQVAGVFRVVLEEGSDHTYLPIQPMRLIQSAGNDWSGGSSGSGVNAAVGLLDNGQVYAVMLEEEDGEGEDVGDLGNISPVGTWAGKKNRHGEGKGGRATATQPLIPPGGDGPDLGLGGGLGGGGHEIPGPLVLSLSTKGPSTRGPSSHPAASGLLRSCQPGQSTFPQCLVGVHSVQLIDGAGMRRGKVGTGYLPRLPPPSFGSGMPPDRPPRADDPIGGGGHRLVPSAPRPHLHALLSWLYRGWSIVSLGILAVVVMVIVDSRRAAKLFLQVGLRGYPLYVEDGAGSGGEYDPTADSRFSGASEASASTAGGGGKEVAVVASGVKSELRVGCLTVSDKVLGYGSHGTVVYRGLLEGRPVAVKRMLTDFHARADREISLLIESDGHPNVVRYFVREEAGEFVYLALQLCQLSLHNAMAQIHAAMAQGRKRIEQEAEVNTPSPRVGLCRALTREDVTAPPELRAALLQVSQGVEHLHSLRIVHRDLKPHNILLAAKERKGHGLVRKTGDRATDAGDGGGSGDEVNGIGEGEDGLEALQKLSSMQDVTRFVLKISDMGLGKQLLNGQSSFGMSSFGRLPGGGNHALGGDPLPRAKESNRQSSSSAGGHVGSIGWQAPEVIADRVRLEGGQAPPAPSGAETAFSSIDSSSEPSWAMEARGQNSSATTSTSSRRTQAVDVFSLGCVFHHCIVPGSHPFGNWYEREANIIQNSASRLEELAHIPDAHDLVSLMTAREPDARPSAAEVCKHPFFWNEERRLSFLLEFSDRLEQDAVQSPLLVMVEAGAGAVVGRSWDIRLDPELTEDAGRYRKYDFSSVRDLLRVVRNKRHHFHELPERVKGLMSPLPGGFLRYVEGRFPRLLMHCAKVTGALLSDERLFKEYLVPFRRPMLPNGATASRAQQEVAAETAAGTGTGTMCTQAGAASNSDGQAKDVPREPLPSLGWSPASKSGALASRTPLPASELPSLPPEEDGAVGPEDEGEAGAFPDSSSVENGKTGKAGETGVGVRSKEAGEGRLSGGSSEGGVGLPSPVSKSSASAPCDGDGKPHGGGGVEGTVTEQNGPRGEGALRDVLLWNKSAVAKSMGCRGWWRHQDHWRRRLDVAKQRPRAAHLNKALQDPKYRTRLCSHWENSKGTLCPMRRRGASKCDFAHGGIELRVRANKRDRWGRHAGANGDRGVSLDASGGEDTLGVARSIGRIRTENGEKDGAGSSLVHGARGGGGGGAAGTAGGGARQSKRSKSGGAQGAETVPGGGNSGGYQGRLHVGSGGGKLGDHLPSDLDVAGPHQRVGNGGSGNQSRSPRGRGRRLEHVGPPFGATPPSGRGIFVAEDGAARQPSQMPLPTPPAGGPGAGTYRSAPTVGATPFSGPGVYVAEEVASRHASQMPLQMPPAGGRGDGAYRSPVTPSSAITDGTGERDVGVRATGNLSHPLSQGYRMQGLAPRQVLAKPTGRIMEGAAGNGERA